MNAIISLCNFCEKDGPNSIFSTQTLRDTKLENLHLDQQVTNKTCSACHAFSSKGIYSQDNESGAKFLSSQVAALSDVAELVKTAAVRSLSCEINSNKDGENFVFFGESSRGHVLSHTFHVSDLQARGKYQLFSIIILMKDKYFLLNTKPFLAEHLRKISTDIQNAAQKVKESEEASGTLGQRRLSNAQAPIRSLIELTGEENIFAVLHSHFTWILLAGSRFLTEHVTFGNLPWLPPSCSDRPPQQRLTYNVTTLPMIQKYEESLDDPDQEEFFSLRHIKQVVRKEFTAICFCALTGIKIIVRGDPERTFHFMLCLKKLLPEQMHHLMRIDAQHQHSISSDYKIISVSNQIAVPIASSSVFRIDFLAEPIAGQDVAVKWPGTLPSKLPDLLVKLRKAVDDNRFTELVLNKHTKVLIEEWKNKVICLTRSKTSTKLRKVLGVQAQDQTLISYWSAHFSST